MTFKIKISYQTGNSFNSYDEIDYLDLTFEDIKVAEDNIERIKNYNIYAKDNYDLWKRPKGKLPKGVIWNDEYRAILLETVDDKGNKFVEWPSWEGHFETLYYAKVVIWEGKKYEP